MTTTDLLTRAQVANLIGHAPRHVPRWTAKRGITGVTDGRHTVYRAADIHAAIDAQPTPAPLRLARFIRNPLNHTAA